MLAALPTQDLLPCSKPLYMYLYAMSVYAFDEDIHVATFAKLIAILWCCIDDILDQ